MARPQRAEIEEPVTAAKPAGWRILVVEDEAVFARAVAASLHRAGHSATIAGTIAQARAFLAGGTMEPPDIVLLDMRLPDGEGFDLLPALSERESPPTVVVMTAYGDVGQAVQAMKLGAADYLKKPIDLDEMLLSLEKVMGSARLRSRLDYSRTRESRSGDLAVELMGNSPALRSARSHIETIAAIGGERAPNVLILGETGTGKDVAARVLHRLGQRADRPFVHIDCTSLPKEIMEAELFGHTRGAFTSAVTARAGLIEAAEDGTVFLDEIGEIPAELQAKLLNVLERRRLRRVGSAREIPVAACFVAATNRNLVEMVQKGTFRDDLFYRLNALTVSLPPLRDCREDIALLAQNFLAASMRAYGRPVPQLGDDAIAALRDYWWPGNVRELRNVIERAALFATEDGITADSFDFSAPAAERSAARGQIHGEARPKTLADAERDLILRALVEAAGNISKAARQLGVTRMALRYRTEKYGLHPDDYRSQHSPAEGASDA